MRHVVVFLFVALLSCTCANAQDITAYTVALFPEGTVLNAASQTATPLFSQTYTTAVVCGLTQPGNWPAPFNDGSTVTLTLASMGPVVIAWNDMSNLPTTLGKYCKVDIGPWLDSVKLSLPKGVIIPWSIRAIDQSGYVSPWSNNGVPAFFSSMAPPAPVNLIIFSRQ